MINNELLSFIKERLAQSETKEQVTEMLVANGGWDYKDVEEAFDAIEMGGTSLPSVLDAMEKDVANQNVPSGQPAVQKEEVKEPVEPVLSPETAIPVVSEIPVVDVEKIQFAEPASAPILTTATIPPTPISFGSSSSSPVQTVTSLGEIPKVIPQDVSGITVISNPSVPVAHDPVMKTASVLPVSAPVESSPVLPAASQSEEVKIDETLQNLRTRFMQGKSVTSPMPASSPRTTPFVSGAKGLSVHTQSGMTPTEKPASISSMPSVQTAKITPRGFQPVSVLPQGQKQTAPGSFPGQKSSSLLMQMPLEKAPGRKLLGFFMFMTGMTLGAVAMHAYLNGYLDFANSLMTQVSALI